MVNNMKSRHPLLKRDKKKQKVKSLYETINILRPTFEKKKVMKFL